MRRDLALPVTPEYSRPNPTNRVDLAERLAEFDRDGSMVAEAAEIWTLVAARAPEIVRAFWESYESSPQVNRHWSDEDRADALAQGLAYMREKLTGTANQRWADMACANAMAARTANVPVTVFLAALTQAHSAMMRIVTEACGADVERSFRLAHAAVRLAVIEADTMMACANAADISDAKSERERTASMFREKIGDAVEGASTNGAHLDKLASRVADSARGMLGKTAEVAAAAEQSAVAMHDAAETAAGLIRAIEQARGEVEEIGRAHV